MKKLVSLILLSIFIPSVCLGGVQAMHMMMIGQEQAAGSSPSALYTAATVVYDFENNGNDTKGTHNLSNGTGSPTFGSTSPPQGSYYATFDDASSQFFTVDDHADFDLGAQDWSASFWYRPHDGTDGNSIMEKWLAGNGISIEDGSSQLRLFLWTSASSSNNSSLFDPTDNTWYHVAVSYDNAPTPQITWWISSSGGTFGDQQNGYNNSPTQIPTDNAGPIHIGLTDSGANYMDGDIDEMVLWFGTEVTATDAENLYDGTWR